MCHGVCCLWSFSTAAVLVEAEDLETLPRNSREKAAKELDIIIDYQMHGILDAGYQWYVTQLQESLFALSGQNQRKDTLLFEAWFYIGHLRHYCSAPVSAATAYETAVCYAPFRPEPWRELGTMRRLLGEPQKARKCLEISLILSSQESEYRRETELEISEMERFELPQLQPDPVAEHLANFRPYEAWNAIQTRTEESSARTRVRVLGAMDAPNCLESWKELALSADLLQLDAVDFFFLPVSLWESAAFWDVVRSMSNHLTLIAMLDPGNPAGNPFGPDELFGLSNEALQANVEEKVDVICSYHQARISADSGGLASLAKRHPNWPYPAKTLDFIASNGRGPTKKELGYVMQQSP